MTFIGEPLANRERTFAPVVGQSAEYEPSGIDEFVPATVVYRGPPGIPPGDYRTRATVEVADGAIRTTITSVVCDVCSAARLAEKGVMASRVSPEELHATCRAPGECACDCEAARGGRCVNCGRTRHADELESATGYDGASCVDRKSCAEAMLASPPAAKPAKATLGQRDPSRTPPARPKAPKPSRGPAPACTCGCGDTTGGGMYKPGHDAKHLKRLFEDVRGGSETFEAALASLPTDALRVKLKGRLEV